MDNITIIDHIKVDKIASAIKLITGLVPIETITEERYVLSLGEVDPIEVGYDKKRKLLSEDSMSFSAHVTLLEHLAKFMKDEAHFLIWRTSELENKIEKQ